MLAAAAQMEYLRPLTCSILSERRSLRPYGLLGGHAALPGLNLLIHPDGRRVNMGGKTSVQVKAGDRIRILTPGMHCPVRLPTRQKFRLQLFLAWLGLLQSAAAQSL